MIATQEKAQEALTRGAVFLWTIPGGEIHIPMKILAYKMAWGKIRVKISPAYLPAALVALGAGGEKWIDGEGLGRELPQ